MDRSTTWSRIARRSQVTRGSWVTVTDQRPMVTGHTEVIGHRDNQRPGHSRTTSSTTCSSRHSRAGCRSPGWPAAERTCCERFCAAAARCVRRRAAPASCCSTTSCRPPPPSDHHRCQTATAVRPPSPSDRDLSRNVAPIYHSVFTVNQRNRFAFGEQF